MVPHQGGGASDALWDGATSLASAYQRAARAAPSGDANPDANLCYRHV